MQCKDHRTVIHIAFSSVLLNMNSDAAFDSSMGEFLLTLMPFESFHFSYLLWKLCSITKRFSLSTINKGLDKRGLFFFFYHARLLCFVIIVIPSFFDFVYLVSEVEKYFAYKRPVKNANCHDHQLLLEGMKQNMCMASSCQRVGTWGRVDMFCLFFWILN